MTMVDLAPVGFREPPNNIDAEQALLGAILVNNEGYRRVAHILRADHFYEPVHRRIYDRMAALVEAGTIANHITLQRAFKEDEALKQLDGPKYIADLARAAETVLNVEDYAVLIKDLAAKRALIHAAEQATAKAYDPQTPETAPQMLAGLFDHINAIASDGGKDPSIASLDVVAALEAPRPSRHWVVEDWVPKRRVTLLSGDGGSGKSLLAQQLATSVAVGMPWLGQTVFRGRVSLFATEDDTDELTIRHQDVCRDLTADAVEIKDHLRLVPRVGMENRLIEFEGDIGRLTTTWQALCYHLETWNPALLILDNAAQIYAGNENSRPQVTWFCNRLEHLCQTYQTTIILLGHTSKATGSEWSGSTAWNACVRSRIFLGPHAEEEDVKVLTRAKSNYAKKGEALDLVWDAGILRPHVAGQEVSLEELGRARQTFKDAIDLLTKRDINVSHLKTSPRNYAPKIIREQGLAGEHSPKSLEKAMWSLIDEGHVLTSQPFGRTAHGNKRTGLKRLFAYDE